MKSQESNINGIDKIIDRAIREDLKARPGFNMAQKIMSNVYQIYNTKNVESSPAHKIDFAYLTFYIGSIAASIMIGYFIGNMYDMSSNMDMIKVSFENIGLDSFSII